MKREFKLPDVGEGVAEGELVSWLVEVGEDVAEDQPIAEVETDKALVEIPSPFEGRVAELRAEEGEMVPVGEVIIVVDVADDEDAEPEVEPEPAGDESAAESEASEDVEADSGGGRTFAPPSVRRLARELGVDIDAVAGSGPSGRVTESDVRAAAEGRESSRDTAEDTDERPGPRSVGGGTSAVERSGERAEPESAEPVESAERDRTLATPATRRIADELGVDVDAVPASEEREGEAYVTEADVRAYAERTAAETEAAKPEPRSVEADATAVNERTKSKGAKRPAEPSAGDTVPYRGVRRSIGEQMERSKYTAPHVTHTDEVDVSELVALRADLNEHADVHLTYMPFVLKAVVAALKDFPYVNASLDEEAEEIRLHDEYNVGMATATDAGLLVPVVDDVDGKSIPELAAEVSELAEGARNRTLSREEMQGGTFTVTNVGVIGGEYATPILNYPEVAILALGAIKERPWVEDGEVVARETLTLSLSIDHRVVDGAVAARFTNRLKELLANPTRLLLE